MTSSEITNELKEKIKKLAIELNTTQEEIIYRAIILLEKNLGMTTSSTNPKARKIMRNAAEKRKNIPWRQKIREALQKPGIDIDELRIGSWSELDED